MAVLNNPYRGQGLDHTDLAAMPWPIADASAPLALLAHCPAAADTPLATAADLAAEAGVAALWVKDERGRMGLGSFKALGAAYAIAREVPDDAFGDPANALAGRTYVAASAGNHGLSVAAGARIFGAEAVIYLSDTVPEQFAQLLQAKGARTVRAGAIYEESMAAAMRAAEAHGWTLLSDSSWPGYSEPALAVMEGYTVLAAEAAGQVPDRPTHIVLQAGVGGMAAAVAAHARMVWGDDPVIIVIEPDAAPALHGSIAAGKPVAATGPVSSMGRLDCKEPSLIALRGLARDADGFALVSDMLVEGVLPRLASAGLAASPSGGAGLAAVLAGTLDLPEDARVLCILSEGPV